MERVHWFLDPVLLCDPKNVTSLGLRRPVSKETPEFLLPLLSWDGTFSREYQLSKGSGCGSVLLFWFPEARAALAR